MPVQDSGKRPDDPPEPGSGPVPATPSGDHAPGEHTSSDRLPGDHVPGEQQERRWRINLTLPVVKLAGAVLLLALGLLFANGDPVQLAVSVMAAAGLLIWGVRDLLVPVRLAAGPAGLTVVHGYAGHRRLPWSVVERIAVSGQPRYGLRNELLEVDCGESIHLFSRNDLGAEPAEVAEVLRSLRARAD